MYTVLLQTKRRIQLVLDCSVEGLQAVARNWLLFRSLDILSIVLGAVFHHQQGPNKRLISHLEKASSRNQSYKINFDGALLQLGSNYGIAIT